MIQQLFDAFVLFQDKTLTGSWNPAYLFLIVLIVYVTMTKLRAKKGEDIDNNKLMMQAAKIAAGAVVLNFITGNLFKSRQRLYKSRRGFSSQRARAQAYADSRMGHIISGAAGMTAGLRLS